MTRICIRRAIPDGLFLGLKVTGSDDEADNTWVCQAFIESEDGQRRQWSDAQLRKGVTMKLRRSDVRYFGRTEINFTGVTNSKAKIQCCILRPLSTSANHADRNNIFGRGCCVYEAEGTNGQIDQQIFSIAMKRT